MQDQQLAGADWAEIEPPPQPVRGACKVPGSKSLTNRALLLAGFARGKSTLTGLLHSEDALWCQDVLARLGMACTPHFAPHVLPHSAPHLEETNCVQVQGCGGMPPQQQASLWLGDAGTLARFLPGLLAAAPAGRWQVDGSEQLRQRPLAPLVTALVELGGHIKAASGGGLPLSVSGGGLRGGHITLAGDVSSQYISGVLMAAAVGQLDLTVSLQTTLVQPAYVAMTLAIVQAFGANIRADADNRRWQVQPAPLQGCRMNIEADVSTACYFWSAAAATGGHVRVTNVFADCAQADMKFLSLLHTLGCTIHQDSDGIAVGGPAVLRGHFIADLSGLSDQAPTLAALAALADGPVTLTGIAHIRHHESDRLAAIAAVLTALGGQVCKHPDGMTITPKPLHGAHVPSYEDHRIAMATALLGLRVPGVRIGKPQCVAKTCPNYFRLLQSLGVTVHVHGGTHG